MAITAQGLYSDRARSLFGMQATAVATSTTSPIETFARGQQELINRLTAAGKDQIQLLKAQIKLLTDIKKSQSTLGISDLLMTKILTKFTAGLFGGLSRVGTIVGASVAGSGVAAVKLLSPMTKGITEGVAKLSMFLKTGVLELVSGTTKFFGNMFSSISRTIASVGRPVANVMAALTSLKAGSMADFGGGILKSFGKVSGILGKIGSKFLIPLAAIFTAFDLFKGFNNADDILGRNGVGIIGKIGSAISSTVNSLLMGIPDWISDKLGFKNFAQMVDSGGIALGDYTSKMADTVKGAISGTFDYVTSFASGITDYIKSLWESAKASSIGKFLSSAGGLLSSGVSGIGNTFSSLGLVNQTSPVAITNAVAINAIQQTNRVANTAIQTQQQGVEALEDSLDKSLKEQKNGIFAALTNFLGNAWDTTAKSAAVFGGMAADLARSTPDLVSRGAGGSVSGANETPLPGTSGGIEQPFTTVVGTQNPSGRPTTPTPTGQSNLSTDQRGRVAPGDLHAKLVDSISNSALNGYVPQDGAKYGITTGSPDEWAKFMTHLSYIESGHKTGTVGDVGMFGGHGSRGLFQLSPQDAVNYGLNNKQPFSYDQLADPNVNTQAAVDIMAKNVTKAGVIAGQGPKGWRGAAAYWGPLRKGWSPGAWGDKKLQYTPTGSQGTAAGSQSSGRMPDGIPGELGSSVLQPQINSRGTIRNKPVDRDVLTALDYAAKQQGLMAEVVSGGQDEIGKGNRRTGSTRHDGGASADVKFFRYNEAGKKQYVDFSTPEGQEIFKGIVRDSAAAGMTGIGAGSTYMGNQTIHIGKGKRAVWGGIRGERVPAWLADAANQGWKNPVDVHAWYRQQEHQKKQQQLEASSANAVDTNTLNGIGSKTIGTTGVGALSNVYKEQGAAIGKGIVETVDSQPQQPTFTPAPISSPLTPAQPPVPGSINAQNPKGAPSDPVSAQPSTKDISSIDEYSMLMINSSVMA